MDFGVAILPLLGGFVFCRKCNSFKYRLYRSSGYRTEDHNVKLVTYYAREIEKLGKEEGSGQASDFLVVIPKDTIAHTARFDPSLEDYFPDGPELPKPEKESQQSESG